MRPNKIMFTLKCESDYFRSNGMNGLHYTTDFIINNEPTSYICGPAKKWIENPDIVDFAHSHFILRSRKTMNLVYWCTFINLWRPCNIESKSINFQNWERNSSMQYGIIRITSSYLYFAVRFWKNNYTLCIPNQKLLFIHLNENENNCAAKFTQNKYMKMMKSRRSFYMVSLLFSTTR